MAGFFATFLPPTLASFAAATLGSVGVGVSRFNMLATTCSCAVTDGIRSRSITSVLIRKQKMIVADPTDATHILSGGMAFCAL